MNTTGKKSKNDPLQYKRGRIAIHQAQADKRNLWIGTAFIAAVIFLIYLPVFSNGLVNLDDDHYLNQQPLIRSLNVKALFSQYVLGNYHPLVMSAYMVLYHLFGLEPAAYHTTSLVLHIVNSCLVLWLLYYITASLPVSLMAGLLFGIHPLHVESVAWASELKDVMYAMGFLASLIFYVRYVKQGQPLRLYLWALLFFLFSLLSKGMAVSLTVVLILIDFYLGRKINAKTLTEKVPFLILSILFGVVAIKAQQSAAALEDIETFSLSGRIVFACYGFVTYIVRLFIPVNLCAYYPYPVTQADSIPQWYYIYPVLIILLLAVVFYSLKKSKIIFLGAGFYSVTVFLVLQLLPVGGTIMADRYSYIPSIGIFLLMGEGLVYLSKRTAPVFLSFSPAALAILGIFILFFSYQTNKQVKIWKDSITLWTNVIDHYPSVSIAFNNRGTVYKDSGNFEKAIADFNQSIHLNPKRTYPYINRGTIYGQMGRPDDALQDFNAAIGLDSTIAETYYNRGIAYNTLKRKTEACADFKKAAQLGYAHSADAFRDLCK